MTMLDVYSQTEYRNFVQLFVDSSMWLGGVVAAHDLSTWQVATSEQVMREVGEDIHRQCHMFLAKAPVWASHGLSVYDLATGLANTRQGSSNGFTTRPFRMIREYRTRLIEVSKALEGDGLTLYATRTSDGLHVMDKVEFS